MKMKKVIALLLSMMLVLTMSLPALAEEPEKGSITINGVSSGNVYSIYKLLDLESYDKTEGAYSYKVNDQWTGFFATGEALNYVLIDNAGYVTWIAGEDDDTVAAFAKLALAYAKVQVPKANGEEGETVDRISPIQSSENEGEFVITTNSETQIVEGKFSNLNLGYYLIDSTMGALCGLTTTNPDASINAKNSAPTIEKQVYEDSTTSWGTDNTEELGTYYTYRIRIDVNPGAESYVIHDKFDTGIDFGEFLGAKHVVDGTNIETGTDVDAEYYTVVTGDDLDDDCTFEVRFNEEFCEHISVGDSVYIWYTAKLNANAYMEGQANQNEATLEFGENHYTTPQKVTTKAYAFDLVKTDSEDELLDGAEFRIYDAATEGNEIKVVKLSDGSYRRAIGTEEGENIVVKDGMVRIKGFDNGTYYLQEVVTPEGYNQLTNRQKFTIFNGNLDAVFNGPTLSTGSGVHVVNKTGSKLPETGARGTMMFITFGMIVVLATGVLLVTKKRMGMIQD